VERGKKGIEKEMMFGGTAMYRLAVYFSPIVHPIDQSMDT
jgi:hypothetical protein